MDSDLGICPKTGLKYTRLPKLKQFDDTKSLMMRVVEKKSSKGQGQKRMLNLRYDYIVLAELTTPVKVKRFLNVNQVKEVYFYDAPNKIRTTVLKFRPTVDRETKEQKEEVDMQFTQIFDSRNVVDDQMQFEKILRRIAEVRKISIEYHTATSMEELSRLSYLQKNRKAGYQSPDLQLKERRKSLPPEQGGLPESAISKAFNTLRTRSQSSSPTGQTFSPTSSSRNGSLPPQSPTRTQRGKSAPPSSGLPDSDFGPMVGDSLNGSFSSMPSTRSRTVSIGVCNDALLPPPITTPKALAAFSQPNLRFIRVIEKKSAKGPFQKRVLALTHSKLVLAELNCAIKRYLSYEYIEHIYYQPKQKANGKKVYQYLVKVPSEGVDILFQQTHDDRNDHNEDQDSFQRVIQTIFRARSLSVPFELLPEQPDLVREAQLQKPEGWVKPTRKIVESPSSPMKQRTSSWFGGMSRRNSKPPESPQTSVPRQRQNAEHEPTSPTSPVPPLASPPLRPKSNGGLTANGMPDQGPIVLDLYNGLMGDEQLVFRALGNVNTNQQWSDVRRMFKGKYPSFYDGEPISAMKTELRGRDYKKCEEIFAAKGIAIDGPLLKAEECGASTNSGEPMMRLNSALKRQRSEKEDDVSPPVSPAVLRQSDPSAFPTEILQDLQPIAIPPPLAGAVTDPNTKVLFIRVVERINAAGSLAQRVVVITPQHFIMTTFTGCVKRFIPLENIHSAIMTRDPIRQYLLSVPTEDSDINFITSTDERNPDEPQTALMELLVKLFKLRNMPFPHSEVNSSEDLKEFRRQPVKRRASIAPTAISGICSVTGLVTATCPASLQEHSIPDLLYIRVVCVECRTGGEHTKAVLTLNHTTLHITLNGEKTTIPVQDIRMIVTQIIDHSGVPATLYLIKAVGKSVLVALSYDERNASHDQDSLRDVLRDVLSHHNVDFEERQLSSGDDIMSFVRGDKELAKEDRKVPTGLQTIDPPAEFKRFNYPNLLFIRIVEKISAKGMKQKRILMLTTQKLIVADEKTDIVKRYINVELITDMSLQLTTVKHSFFGKEDHVYNILLRVPSEGLDLLFVQSYDARNASHDQEEFPRILRAVLAQTGKSLVERHVNPSENMAESAVLKKVDTYKSPEAHIKEKLAHKNVENAVDDMFGAKQVQPQAAAPVPSSTDAHTPAPQAPTTTDAAAPASPTPAAPAAPTSAPAEPTPLRVPVHEATSIEAQELERLRAEVNSLKSPQRDVETEELRAQNAALAEALKKEAQKSDELKTLVDYLHKENTNSQSLGQGQGSQSTSEPADSLELARLQNEVRSLKKEKGDVEMRLKQVMAQQTQPVLPDSETEKLIPPPGMLPKKAPAQDTFVDYSKLSEDLIAILTQAGVEPHEMSVFNVLAIRQCKDLGDVSTAELKEYLPGPLVRRVLRAAGYQTGRTEYHTCVPLGEDSPSRNARKEEKARKIAQERLRIVQSENASLRETIQILKEQIRVLRGQRGIPSALDYDIHSPVSFSSTSAFSPSPAHSPPAPTAAPIPPVPLPTQVPAPAQVAAPTPVPAPAIVQKSKREISQDRSSSMPLSSECGSRRSNEGKSARSAERARLKAEARAAQEELDRRLREEEMKRTAARQLEEQRLREAQRMEEMALRARKEREEAEEAEKKRQAARERELQEQKKREVEEQLRAEEEAEEEVRRQMLAIVKEEHAKLKAEQEAREREEQRLREQAEREAVQAEVERQPVPEPVEEPLPQEPEQPKAVEEVPAVQAEVVTAPTVVEEPKHEEKKADEQPVQVEQTEQAVEQVPEPVQEPVVPAAADEQPAQVEQAQPEEQVPEPELVPVVTVAEEEQAEQPADVQSVPVQEPEVQQRPEKLMFVPEPEVEPSNEPAREMSMEPVHPEATPTLPTLESSAFDEAEVTEPEPTVPATVPPIKDMPRNVPAEQVRGLPDTAEVSSESSATESKRNGSSVSSRSRKSSVKAEGEFMAMITRDFDEPVGGFAGLDSIMPGATVHSSDSE